MLSPLGQHGLEAKFYGLIGFCLGLVLGLVKHWPLSHVSWPRGLNKIYVIHLVKNKHVSGPKHYC